jgi:hypothetical protein
MLMAVMYEWLIFSLSLSLCFPVFNNDHRFLWELGRKMFYNKMKLHKVLYDLACWYHMNTGPVRGLPSAAPALKMLH